ncbi:MULTISPECIES: hypothetical protein [Streptomyces]|uniref:Integral membrane protein n=1 Tax=Streptomyces xanthii TaxID=2768069 RepID=A0A7H1BAN1_9ACTN|nr:hypothetical protein [Streptomyces xanthii]QNS05786.1 hypothetical protein IAG42_20815 [Streptomyces xanthii]
MYGPGAAPPPRTDGGVVAMRVLFAALSVLSCGLLASVPLFRIAYLRKRTLDWVLASVALPVTFALFAVVGSLPETDRRTDVALAAILIIGAASAVYFVVFDVRRVQATPLPAPYPPTAQTVGYGYPPVQHQPAPQPPYTHPTVSQTGFATHQTLGAAPQHPAPQHAHPTPPPVQPQPQQPQGEQGQPPHRIDQVRAELDELSDYLRQQDGGR